MNGKPLEWSAPPATGLATIEARDGTESWRITPVPDCVTRIHYSGRDANGLIVSSTAHAASTESLEEALILVDLLENGGHDLPSWRDQLVAAGFRSDYAENVDDACHMLWHDDRETGRYQIAVKENHVDRFGDVVTSVTATYEADRSSVWHQVLDVDGSAPTIHCIGEVRYRDGLPEGVDALGAGVAAAIAIRDARRDRGGRFAEPLGGKTRKR